MKRFIFIILPFVLVVASYSQNGIEQVLSSIERNNTTLKALREQANAQKIGNKTMLNLENPEVEFERQWGNARAESNKYDLSLKQSFDFPTAYHYRSQLVNQLNRQADLNYQQQRKEILQQVRIFCVELVYQLSVKGQLEQRVKDARELNAGYETKFEKGDIDIIERNKTKINLLNTEKALQMNGVEITTLYSELQRMNGGLPLDGILKSYDDYLLPVSFDEWFERAKTNNPLIQLNEQQIESSRKEERLTRAMNLPKITAGYVNAYEGGGRFNGFTVGVSIPLWGGHNTVKQKKAQTYALQVQSEDNTVQFRNTLRNQYEKAHSLEVLLDEYKSTLENTNNQYLLNKAFEKGQLSLITYLQELTVYYETLDKYLEMQRDYQLAVAELQQWE